jgi:RNA polymerase sigma-70 factor (ECF subfamily)
MKRMLGDDPVSHAWRAHRPYLVDLAFRMLGDVGAAEDVVQEAFSRLLVARRGEIEDERGWLIVVTSRLCFDQIKSARSRRERPADVATLDRHPRVARSLDPADRVTLDDSIRLALIVVLQRLSPPERVAFVLHDVFQLPFDIIAETVGRTPASCRQLARRARQQIEHAEKVEPKTVDLAQHHLITERFIAACSSGDFTELLAVLDPDAAGTIDTREGVKVVGADRVAQNLLRYWGGPDVSLVSQPISDQPALLGYVDRALAGILLLTIEGELIKKIHVLADSTKLAFVESQLASVAAE